LPPISGVVYPPPALDGSGRDAQAQELRATNNAQAAIGAFNLGLFALLRRCGCTPDFLAGHSLGELTALCAGGALSEDDYLSLLVARGEAMAQPPPSGVDPGALLAIGGDTAMIEAFLRDRPGVTIANRNSRTQLVVAGAQDELSALKAELAALGVTATSLPVSGAFHSHRVAHAQEPFARALAGVRLAAPRTPVFANTTGAPYPSAEDAVRRLLAEQLLRPVEFRRQIEAIHDAGGRVFVECGPGRVLTGLVGNILSDRPHVAIALNRTRASDELSLRDAYVQLRVAGVALADLDPWQSLPDAPERPRGPVVRLSGAPYKSEPTQLAFEEALDTRKRAPEAAMVERETRSDSETGDPSAAAHLRYLENLADYSRRHFELTQQLYALATNPACSPAALASFERAVSGFHEIHLTAQHVHAQFLGLHGAATASVERARAPVAPRKPVTTGGDPDGGRAEDPRPAPVPPPAAPQGPRERDAAPRPGPDGASPKPGPSPASKAEAKVAPPGAAPRPSPAAPPAPRAAAPSPVASGQRAEDIAAILLSVISEKTGYPLDSLEVTMDVDSDLGIDSLKRVEIMAALEGRLFKRLSGIDFSAFATRRTVADIARFLAEVG
jgi:malonyl CoA-acyl carrier protein transacylase/acyl carrier protein